jgi:hypothetical protein
MIQQFGEDKVPDGVKNKEGSEKNRKYTVIHTCEPNPDYDPDPNNINPLKHEYISYYILVEGEDAILKKGGYKNFPYAISRDTQAVREVYGRSVSMAILPTTKMLNQMKKTDITAKHMAIQPPNLMKDDGSIQVADFRPGKMIVGGLDAAGNPNIVPYNTGVRVDISDVARAEEQGLIREAFMLDLFINNLEREATATEVMTRSSEQARLLAPLTGREETESFAPQIERELQLLEDIGALPPMPPELIEAGGEFEIEFKSPIANSQKADEAIGASQTIQAAIEVSAFAPEIMDKVDVDEYMDIISEANGTPSRMVKSDEMVAQIREARAKEQQMAQMMEAAQPLSQAGLNAAKAEETLQGIGA